ncbi:hypothetical protein ACUOFC_10980, partial [Escherichia sp. TWPC-MK]
MTHLELVPVPPVAQLAGVSQHYGKTVALNNITLIHNRPAIIPVSKRRVLQLPPNDV